MIDDPESIVRCSNKVYQAELFERHEVPCPKTLIVHRDNADDVGPLLGFPVILKRPDSSFSMGVVKAENEAELERASTTFFDTSELVVAQEFVPSDFDWRIGVLDGEPLWACRYHMARGHWQIQQVAEGGGRRYGRVEALPLADVPGGAVRVAVRRRRPHRRRALRRRREASRRPVPHHGSERQPEPGGRLRGRRAQGRAVRHGHEELPAAARSARDGASP